MNKPIVSTRNIGVVLAKRKRLDRITTKDIDASIKIKKPKEEPMKSPLISTHNIGDVGDIAEKKKRDEIRAQRKGFNKGDPIYLDDNGKLVASKEEEETVMRLIKETEGRVLKTTEDMNLDMRDEKKIVMVEKKIEIITAPAIVKDREGNLVSTIDGEKKVAMAERMAKVRAGKNKK